MGPSQTHKPLHRKGNHKLKKKIQPIDQDKVFANDATDKRLISLWVEKNGQKT